MLPKPSLVLQVRLRPEEYSDTAAAEIKRSYMYLAQSVVSELDEGERAEGNLMRLNVRLMKPFWDASDPAAEQLWRASFMPWLVNATRNMSTAMHNYNTVLHPLGAGNVTYQWADFDFAPHAVLRLKVDNGESVGFHYYELRVQAGFDEGYLILCNDEEGKGSMAFVKKRSPQEEAEGAQEVWEDLLATINPSYAFRDLRDVYVFSSSSESGVLITSGDEEGSIYHLDPTSLEVTFRLRAMDEYGTRTGRILGEKTSRGHYSYVIGDDGKAYRYEFASDLLAVRQTPYPVKYGYQSYYANTVQGTRVPLMFSESGVVGFPNSNIKGFGVPDGYEVINAAGTRVGTEEYYVIARSTAGEPRKVQIIKSNSGISSQSTVLEYDESRPMLIDRNSTMVPTKVSNNIYYNYDDKIYHWAMLSVTPTLPAEGDRPDITLPEGERIMAICSNAMPSTSATTVDDDLLLIATYNPAATDRKPGSLYIYNLKTLEQVKKYEGICEKPVAVTYKFPTSN